MIGLLRPPAHRPPPEGDVDAKYRRLRGQVFLGIFVGYAGYYLVRKNFALAMPHLIEEGFSKTQLGLALSGVSIAYGLSKFFMGSVSDRSNARTFMTLGLLCSASIMIFMGLAPFATASVGMMFGLLLLNGWFQGMGWPPSGRVMVHWFSHGERGIWMSFWNVAHNIGGGVVGPLAILAMARQSARWMSVEEALARPQDLPQALLLQGFYGHHESLTQLAPVCRMKAVVRESVISVPDVGLHADVGAGQEVVLGLYEMECWPL